jgi:putative DNA primase/helicase
MPESTRGAQRQANGAAAPRGGASAGSAGAPAARREPKPRRPITADVVRSAVACVSPDVDHDTWARMAMALKASDLPEGVAFEIFDKWSSRGATYSQRGTRDTWRSVKASGAVTVGTLFGIAKDHGFKWPELPPVPTPARSRAASRAAAGRGVAVTAADGSGANGSGPGATPTSPPTTGNEDAAGPDLAAELAAQARQRREAEAETWRKRADDTAGKARALWAAAEVEGSSPYLRRKGVQAHGLRFMRDGTLLVPMKDAAGQLQNVQRIAPTRPADGSPEKRFLAGGRKTGLFHLVGRLEGAGLVLLAEGYATGATLHEATGHPVAVAFDAGNLVHVARELRNAHPRLPLLVCADNDHETESVRGINTGRAKAAAAVRAALATEHDATGPVVELGMAPATGATEPASPCAVVGPARVVYPVFAAQHAAGRSDFNDLAAVAGAGAVCLAIDRALAAMLDGEPDPELKPRRILPPSLAGADAAASPTNPTNGPARPERRRGRVDTPPGAAQARSGPESGDPTDPDSGADMAAGAGQGGGSGGGGDGGGGDPPDGSPTPADSGDAFAGGRDPFLLDEGGVFYLARDREGNDRPPQWLCAPLRVTARTRADDANGWGCLLEFMDPDGNAKTWAMPAAMLSGEGSEWAGRLRDMGLRMAPGTAARNRIAQYIDTRDPAERVTCTDRVGWHGPVYVLPSSSIGTAEGRRYVFQSDAGMEDTFHRRGTLADWQSSVAALLAGNSRLAFAVCAALAGPLVRPAGMESGGFHFRGTSSMGKTTALRLAASVWGRPTFMQRWRTTDNALEATAVQHCDCTLILDEFGQLDPRVAGECAYMLANDQEKGRATRGGLARKRRTWRLLFLSSGEVSLSDHMAEAGKRVQAGQEVRMVDIPLDAGAGMGGLEFLHGRDGAAELADEATAAAARCYGIAGRAWLEWCTAHHAELPERAQALIERIRSELVPEAAAEQVRRIGSRFALVAAAGELATEAGITGWQPGHASWAARQCFNAWLSSRGHLGNAEELAALRGVQAFIEKNGDALFTWMHRGMDDHRPATPYRAGFKRMIDDDGKPLKIDVSTDYVDKLSTPESSPTFTAHTEYLVLPEAWRRDVCKGLGDAVAVAAVLKRRGHLVHDEARLTKKVRLPGVGLANVYQLRPSILSDTGE